MAKIGEENSVLERIVAEHEHLNTEVLPAQIAALGAAKAALEARNVSCSYPLHALYFLYHTQNLQVLPTALTPPPNLNPTLTDESGGRARVG